MVEDSIYIACGIGYYYSVIKEDLDEKLCISYVYDRRWECEDVDEYGGIPIIRKQDMAKLPNAVAVIVSIDSAKKASIAKDLSQIGMEYVFIEAILGYCQITGAALKKLNSNIWEDDNGNRIEFDESLPDNVKIFFEGRNNRICFGSNLILGDLTIGCGNDGECQIGDNTEIVSADIQVAYAKVSIGRDCLISKNVVIRTHDAHYIFDKNTLDRLNFAESIRIGDQVWIAEKAMLLPGAEIGTGSVVGTNTITSSKFGEFCIIAGVPGKVIKENICWGKDYTAMSNYSNLKECYSKDALKYF